MLQEILRYFTPASLARLPRHSLLSCSNCQVALLEMPVSVRRAHCLAYKAEDVSSVIYNTFQIGLASYFSFFPFLYFSNFLESA